ncbi:Unconventional myosin [Seminavis robusta]|uniref:Unconventional myosin n=1 Tax=Seminavis robusta TaxID=568900 RepID=A0A9N8EHJ1_9STRA|nr:Unconventional myosin [Seminavis robusta]|eukprot:Sro1108_g242140.1 Unconventional myosin (1126) ;mRNA; f:1437-4908
MNSVAFHATHLYYGTTLSGLDEHNLSAINSEPLTNGEGSNKAKATPGREVFTLPQNNNNDNQKWTAVYVYSDVAAWIPAALVKQEGTNAWVMVPNFPNEQSMMQVDEKWKKNALTEMIDTSGYENGILPLQNVDQHKGHLCEWGDMVGLPYLHEAAILYNLKKRHLEEKPYTRTGDIMIALNPYQWLTELYTNETRMLYAQELIWNVSDKDPREHLEPHVYEVAALSYKGMAVDGLDQSVLVSGESGAGKTETVKLCMNFVASVHDTTTAAASGTNNTIVQRILDSAPMLEAFGNAKTRRNDNSSRFGKYTQLQLDRSFSFAQASAQLAGSKNEVYLLEKNRVVSHATEERTFHIFYQLLAAPDTVKQSIWEGLVGTTNESFAYVGPTTCDSIEGKTDGERFELVTKALNLLGIQGGSFVTLMRCISIVLQLGNIGFQPLPDNEDAAQIATIPEFEALAELMGISQEDLTAALTKRTFLARGELMTVLLKADQAKDSCHALAKEIYGQAFLWLVKEINAATCAENNYKPDGGAPSSFGIIGLLDIFGFESFDTNQFEQICINYANEKLQQKFTEDIFRSVQKEYEEEGLNLADIAYDDNSAILKLIEGRGGILDLLNEECMLPKSNPINFTKKVRTQLSSSPHLDMTPLDHVTFRIKHYAGPVEYLTENFIELNRDSLPADLKRCASSSTNAIIAQEFKEPQETRDELEGSMQRTNPKRAKSGMTNETLSSRYRTQLSDLMKDLRKTQSRYIRCIKPNTLKKAKTLEHQTTVEQLRYAGIIAGITISRSAFPNRLPNTTVLARYKTMWDKKKFPSSSQINDSDDEKRRADCIAMLTGLLEHMTTRDKSGKEVKAFVAGKTKTYFRGGALEFLQSQRLNAFDSLAATIQTAVRAWIIRQRYKARRQRAAEFRREMKVYYDEIAALKAQLQEEPAEELAALKERALKAQTDTKDLKRKIDITEKSEAMKIQQEYAVVRKALDEKQAEEDRLRKLNQHIDSACQELEKKAEKLRSENKKLESEKEEKKEQTKTAKAGSKNYNRMRQDLARIERENKDMERELKKKKLQHMQAEKQRFDVRTGLLKLFNFIGSECKDEALVDEVLTLGRSLGEKTQALVGSLPEKSLLR